VTKYLVHVGFRYWHDYCLVPGMSSVECPRGQHVWVFKYSPGLAGRAG